MNDPKNTPPNQDESGLPTTPNAQSRAAYFEDMLPGVIASDERDGRVVQASKRRRSGIPLSVDEVRRDLKAVLSQLTVSYMQYDQGFSTFLRTPAHALDYAERVAAYAIKDYPSNFENDPDIAGLWKALNNIQVMCYAWRKGEDKTDGKLLVATVNKIATDAINRIYPTAPLHSTRTTQTDLDGIKAIGPTDPTTRISKSDVMAAVDKATQPARAADKTVSEVTQASSPEQIVSEATQANEAVLPAAETNAPEPTVSEVTQANEAVLPAAETSTPEPTVSEVTQANEPISTVEEADKPVSEVTQASSPEPTVSEVTQANEPILSAAEADKPVSEDDQASTPEKMVSEATQANDKADASESTDKEADKSAQEADKPTSETDEIDLSW